MCYELEVGDEIVTNVGGLKKVINKVVFDEVYSKPELLRDTDCLCCIDFEKTAKENNLNCKLDVSRGVWKVNNEH